MTLSHTAILILSLAIAVVLYVSGLDGLHALPWLMFFTATATGIYGLRVGIAAALGSLLLLLLFRESALDYLMMVAILLLSTYLSNQIGRDLREAHRKSHRLTQLQDVFLRGLEALPRFPNREQLLRQLPTMLSQLL